MQGRVGYERNGMVMGRGNSRCRGLEAVAGSRETVDWLAGEGLTSQRQVGPALGSDTDHLMGLVRGQCSWMAGS